MTSGETALESAGVTSAAPDVLPLLSGTYHHQVDAKGRVAVPSTLRRWLPFGSVVAPAPDQRLMIWTPAQWAEEQARYRRMAERAGQELKFLRQLSGHTYAFEVDAQGRMLLSPWQRAWTGIADKAVFIGITIGVELCSESTWEAEVGELDNDEFRHLRDLVFQHSRHDDAGAR